jgi:hypothetical protein
MVKREHIKQAIDAISRRDPEIGYTLDEMLARGRIDSLGVDRSSADNGDFHLLFDGRPITIKRFIFFNEGTVSIEQRLLIKYGEMLKRQELLAKEPTIDYRGAAGELRMAGLKLMVAHEIDYAIQRLQKSRIAPKTVQDRDRKELSDAAAVKRSLISRLESIKDDNLLLETPLAGQEGELSSAVFFRSVVDGDIPAYFTQFPYCLDALMQVADINLEFFQVRLLLDFLIGGTASNLFACVVDNKIEGLVYLTLKERYFYKALEIRYIATVRGAAADRSVYRLRVLKGVGTFLVAGVWLLWKSEPKGVSDLLLDSEIGARRFYDGIGFRPRGFSGYRLEAPQGHLVKTLLDMANRCSMLNETALKAVKSIIKDQVKTLCHRAAGEKKTAARNRALDAVKMCLSSDARPEFAYLAVGELIRNREKIMDYPNLLRFVREYGSDVTRSMLPKAGRSNPKNI